MKKKRVKKGNVRAQALLKRGTAAGLSLGAIARELDIDRSTLTSWRNGQTKRIASPVLDALEMFVVRMEVRKAEGAASDAPQEMHHGEDRLGARAD